MDVFRIADQFRAINSDIDCHSFLWIPMNSIHAIYIFMQTYFLFKYHRVSTYNLLLRHIVSLPLFIIVVYSDHVQCAKILHSIYNVSYGSIQLGSVVEYCCRGGIIFRRGTGI